MVLGQENRGAGKKRPKRACLPRDQSNISQRGPATRQRQELIRLPRPPEKAKDEKTPQAGGAQSKGRTVKSQEEGVLGRGCMADAVWA